MALTATFISFDFDHDEDLKTLLVGQAKNPDTPFWIADYSVKDAMTGDWKTKVRARIKRAEVVAVICGQYTHTASGVAAEVAIAREEHGPLRPAAYEVRKLARQQASTEEVRATYRRCRPSEDGRTS
jgi:hypothetical protein